MIRLRPPKSNVHILIPRRLWWSVHMYRVHTDVLVVYALQEQRRAQERKNVYVHITIKVYKYV